jgi:hypothetical protein
MLGEVAGRAASAHVRRRDGACRPLECADDALAARRAEGRPMSTLDDVRSTLEGVLQFGSRPMNGAIHRLLASLPQDAEIVSVDELAWAMHAEFCDWKFHTATCWNQWRARAATILAEAREGSE